MTKSSTPDRTTVAVDEGTRDELKVIRDDSDLDTMGDVIEGLLTYYRFTSVPSSELVDLDDEYDRVAILRMNGNSTEFIGNSESMRKLNNNK